MSTGAASTGRLRSAVVLAIARREWREWRRDRRLSGLAVLLALLMLAALADGLARARQLDAAQTAAAAADGALWRGQGERHPHAAAHFGQYAFKPESPLALADPGVDAQVGSAVWLEAHRRNEPIFRPARDGDLAARHAPLSLAFVLQVLVPLLIILLAFGSFAGERERGTLRQALSLGTTPLELLAGKALALSMALVLLLVPALAALSGPSVASDSLAAPAGNLLARVGALGLGYALYLGGYGWLALAVSAASRQSRTALTVLIGFWLLNSFVGPRLMTDLARQRQTLPTADAFQAAIAEERRSAFGHDETHPGYRAFRDATLARYGVSRVEDLPVSLRALALKHNDVLGDAIFDRHYARLTAAFAASDRFRAAPGFALPLLAMQPYAMALAGTDSRHHEHFSAAAETHRRMIQTRISDALLTAADADPRADAALWNAIPGFDYRLPTAAWALASQTPNLAALLVWWLLTAAAGVVAAQRLRVA